MKEILLSTTETLDPKMYMKTLLLSKSKDISEVLNLNVGFVEKELNLLISILEGKAILHHMEPTYYRTLRGTYENMRQNEEK